MNQDKEVVKTELTKLINRLGELGTDMFKL